MADLATVVYSEQKLTPEQKLWKAVLSQGERSVQKSTSLPLTYGEMRSAFEWVDLSNRDFCTVCMFAGYDPRYIYRKARDKVNMDAKWCVKFMMHVLVMDIEDMERPARKKKVTIQCSVCESSGEVEDEDFSMIIVVLTLTSCSKVEWGTQWIQNCYDEDNIWSIKMMTDKVVLN